MQAPTSSEPGRWRAGCRESGHVRFGRGDGKGPQRTRRPPTPLVALRTQVKRAQGAPGTIRTRWRPPRKCEKAPTVARTCGVSGISGEDDLRRWWYHFVVSHPFRSDQAFHLKCG